MTDLESRLLQNAEMAKEMGMGDESSGDDDES
jgi:hypothetical protein